VRYRQLAQVRVALSGDPLCVQNHNAHLQLQAAVGNHLGLWRGQMGRSPDEPELQTSHTVKVGIATDHHSLRRLQDIRVRPERLQ